MPRTRTWVLVAAIAFVGGATAITIQTMDARAEFVEYRSHTLGSAEAPWNRDALDVVACVDATIDWTLSCKGLRSWCDASVPMVMERCLASQPRGPYCAEVGDAIKKTSFGYPECEARWTAVDEKYERRATKKHCAAAYRAVAHYCGRT